MNLELTPVLSPAPVLTEETIQGRFERFHREHPNVFDSLVALALEAKARGHKQYSMAAVWEVYRWQSREKLNNDFRARYARKIMDEVAELRDFFETRVLIAA